MQKHPRCSSEVFTLEFDILFCTGPLSGESNTLWGTGPLSAPRSGLFQSIPYAKMNQIETAALGFDLERKNNTIGRSVAARGG